MFKSIHIAGWLLQEDNETEESEKSAATGARVGTCKFLYCVNCCVFHLPAE